MKFILTVSLWWRMECYICVNCLHLYSQGVSNYFWGTIKQNGLPRWCLVVKSPPASAGRCKSLGFDPWVGKIFWRRAWQPTLVLLPRESHGQRSLAGCSPQGHIENMTEEAKQQGDCSPRVEASSTRFCRVHDGQPASQAKRGSSEQHIKILVFK